MYDSTRAVLATRLPHVRTSQLDTLALVVVGVTQSLSAQLGKLARAMPLNTTQYAKEQRLRRFLDNERTQADHYQPLVRTALTGLKGQKVDRLLERVLSDIMGVTGQAIIRAIVTGERDPVALAKMRNPACTSREETIAKALSGTWKQELLFFLQPALVIYDVYTAQIAVCDAELEQ